MATLPLEVHEVLEEEYASMYGVAPADYDAFEIRDAEAARTILRDRGIGAENVEAVLKQMVDGQQDIELLATSTLSEEDKGSRAVRRRLVDAAFGETIVPL